MTTATSQEPRFLFPQSRQFPFDEVCEQIVRALEARTWDVPGITVEFDVYGTGAQKYRLVRTVTGADFKLRFGRPQARLGDWNDTAAVNSITIPQRGITVFKNYRCWFYVYVGDDWANDRDAFTNHIKVNSRLNHKPRTYLKYDGTGQLLADHDLGREYSPEQGEPTSYSAKVVFAEFTQWLSENVLAKILELPETDPRFYVPPEYFFQRRPKPWSDELAAHIGPIFCFGESRDAERVHQGKLDANELEAGDRYGFQGNGYRLLSLFSGGGEAVPEIAYDGFLWCGLGEVTPETMMTALDIPGHFRWSERERFLFRVSPNSSDGIYIADHAAYEQCRSELLAEIKADPRNSFTDAEVAQMQRARARTIMTIVDYAMMTLGDPTSAFGQPVVLINRELGFDEVELVGGPSPECHYVAIVANRSPEARELLEQALLARAKYYRSFDKTDRESDYVAASRLAEYFAGDDELAAAAYSRHTLRSITVDVKFIGRIVDAAGEARRLGLF